MHEASRVPVLAAISRGFDVVSRFFSDRIWLAKWELVLARVLLAAVLWDALPWGAPGFTGQPYPHGLGQWIDFSFVSNAGTFHLMLTMAKVGLVMYALGIAAPLGLALFLLMDVSHHTFFSSQGIQGHGGQITSLIALALLSGHLWHVVRHRSGMGLLLSYAGNQQTSLAAARLMFAGTYVVAGLSKLKYGGFDWWTRGGNFALQMQKAQDEMAFTMVDNPLSDAAVSFGHTLVEHPQLASGMLLGGLLLELGAFLACTGRLQAAVIGIGLLMFHKGNEWLMGLPFKANVHLDVVLFIMPAYWLVLAVTKAAKLKKSTLDATAAPAPGVAIPPTATTSASWPRRVGRFLAAPALLSIALAFFMLWRGEWYPFSNFPMYSILPPSANTLYITDLDGKLIPMQKVGLDSPTMKKMLTSELRKYKADGRVRRMADLTDDNWREAAEKIVAQIRTWKKQRIDKAFQLHRKDYFIENDMMASRTVHIATFTPDGPAVGNLP